MTHIITVNSSCITKPVSGKACGECQTSCQSACKTSCTVANQQCENQNK